MPPAPPARTGPFHAYSVIKYPGAAAASTTAVAPDILFELQGPVLFERATGHGVLRPGRAEQLDQPPHHTLGDIALDHDLVFRFADITQFDHPTLNTSMKCLERLESLIYGSSASRIFPESIHANVVNSSIISSPLASAPMDTLHNRADRHRKRPTPQTIRVQGTDLSQGYILLVIYYQNIS